MAKTVDLNIPHDPKERYRRTFLVGKEEKLMVENERLRMALQIIKRRAASDAPAEELEDVQRDLRHIYATACDALNK